MYVVGFEPTKHNALELESNPFDRSGIRTHKIIKKYKLSMTGFEPATLRLEVSRAIQLRHTDDIQLLVRFNSL